MKLKLVFNQNKIINAYEQDTSSSEDDYDQGELDKEISSDNPFVMEDSDLDLNLIDEGSDAETTDDEEENQNVKSPPKSKFISCKSITIPEKTKQKDIPHIKKQIIETLWSEEQAANPHIGYCFSGDAPGPLTLRLL